MQKNENTSEITGKRANRDLVPTLEPKNNDQLVFGQKYRDLILARVLE